MNEDLCQIIPGTTSFVGGFKWQNTLIVAALVVFFLTVCYFFYKFVSHTNKRFKMVENAINQMNERMKERPVVPEMHNAMPQMFVQQQQPHMPQMQQQPPARRSVPHQAVKQQPPIAVVDTKVLDNELSEELEELNKVAALIKNDEPEGRVDTIQEEEKRADPPQADE